MPQRPPITMTPTARGGDVGDWRLDPLQTDEMERQIMIGGLRANVIDPARQRARDQAAKAGGFGKAPVDRGT